MLLKRLSNPLRLTYQYDNRVTQRQAVALMAIALIIGLFSGVWLVLFSAIRPQDMQPLVVALLFGSMLVNMIVYGLVRTGQLNGASWLFIGFMILATGGALTVNFDSALATAPFVAIVAAGLLQGRRGIIITLPLVLLFTGNAALLLANQTQPQLVVPADNLGIAFGVATTLYVQVALILYGFSGNTQQVVSESLTQVKQTEEIVEFARRHEGVYNEQAIYIDAAELLRTHLGYSFVQVYLIGEDKRLTRRLRTTVTGESDHDNRLIDVSISDANALQNAASLGEVVIVDRNEREVRRSHMLQSSTYSIAIPVQTGREMLAVFDVQTSRPTLSDNDLGVLEAFAAQVANLIATGRRVNGLQNDLSEQAALIESLRRQLRIARQSQSLEADEWSAYLAGRRQGAIGFDFQPGAGQLVTASDLPPAVKSAIEAGEMTVTPADDGKHVLRVPVVLDETVIGAMAFTLDQPPDDQQLSMASTVAQRLAVALENKRLYEQSQSLAIRERKASDAASLLISATDVDAVLKLAAETFNRTMGAVRTHIQLNPDVIRGEVVPLSGTDAPSNGENKGNRS